MLIFCIKNLLKKMKNLFSHKIKLQLIGMLFFASLVVFCPSKTSADSYFACGWRCPGDNYADMKNMKNCRVNEYWTCNNQGNTTVTVTGRVTTVLRWEDWSYVCPCNYLGCRTTNSRGECTTCNSNNGEPCCGPVGRFVPNGQWFISSVCNYISAVSGWSECVNGMQYSNKVTWSQTPGTTCSDVPPLSRSCVPPGPVVDIKANGSDNPIAIDYDTAAIISWTSTDADSCSVTPSGWTEINNPGVSSGNLTATTTYTLTCVNSYGTSTPDSVTICVSNCSCASSTCVGDTCSDGCGGNCAGTMPNTCSSWGSCSKDCGGGIQTKSCFCPSRTETQSCNAQPCSSGYREVTPW